MGVHPRVQGRRENTALLGARASGRGSRVQAGFEVALCEWCLAWAEWLCHPFPRESKGFPLRERRVYRCISRERERGTS